MGKGLEKDPQIVRDANTLRNIITDFPDMEPWEQAVAKAVLQAVDLVVPDKVYDKYKGGQ